MICFLSGQLATVWVAKATCITLVSQHCLPSWICSPEDSALLTEGGKNVCVFKPVCKRDSIPVYPTDKDVSKIAFVSCFPTVDT